MAREYTPDEMQSIVALQDTLYNNPETRPGLLRLVKKVAPHASIPEIDVPQQALASLKPTLDKVATLEARLERSERTNAIEKEWAGHKVTPAERGEIEKLMTDRLIGDVGTAVEYYRNKQAASPAARPAPGVSTLSMPTEGQFKGLFENPDRWAREQASAAINELAAERT